jgi:glycosyltransferase involved in cell wall biosynthesis
MVGSGEEEPKLGALYGELQLPIYDHSDPKSFRTPHSALRTHDAPGVHFYGFRQIDENPVFYALADAFILPSLWEEWGLVVNEAMASGLPVAVSETAGCAEDLLEPGCPAGASSQDREQIQRSGLGNKLRLNGFVFSPNSAQELSLVLVMLEESGNLRAMMGAESRRIVEKFSCENFARSALRAISAAQGESIGARPATEPVKLT